MKITKFRNVMTNHSNVQVGEVIPSYRDKTGKLWKTQVDDVGFFVVIIGSLITGGGTLYILGSIDEEWE